MDTNTTFEDARQTMQFHDHEASKVADALQHVIEEAKEEEAGMSAAACGKGSEVYGARMKRR